MKLTEQEKNALIPMAAATTICAFGVSLVLAVAHNSIAWLLITFVIGVFIWWASKWR